MHPKRRNVPGFGGTIGPGRYFTVGLMLAVLKQALDQLVARGVFGRPWSPWNYAVTGEVGGLFALDRGDQVFYLAMLALALPFLAVGVVLTVRRLRDAGWPLWVVAFFFAPLPINLVFFLILSLVRSRATAAAGLWDDAVDLPAAKSPPRRASPSYVRAVAAILIPLPVGAAAAYLGTHVFEDYGWSLFVGLPFALPMLSVVLYGYGRRPTWTECLILGLGWLAVAVGVLLVTAFEGLICILMALPLVAPVALLGTSVGYFIVGLGPRPPEELGKIAMTLLAVLPAMVGAEHVTRPEPPRFACRTAVVVNAPPERVWGHVIRFPDLDPPTDFLSRAGVAYPVRARIEGAGVGAVRRCEFSTGTFVEPIEVWDEPRLLRFAVTSNPPPMREWNPLFETHPPHLDGFLVSERGQFLLTELPGGRTLLQGTTWYGHGLWPAGYWRLWSDPIIHRIHERVLNHVKALAERESGSSRLEAGGSR